MAVVGILGMTHDEELQKKYNYPLSLVEELITEFNPDVICGEVHPDSWKLFLNEGEPCGVLGETQKEYPNLIYPLCEAKDIEFVPVDWFEEDVFEEEPFDKFDYETREKLEDKRSEWNEQQLSTWNKGEIPLNSSDYDRVTNDMYNWLHTINPEVQNIVWKSRHYIMLARVKKTIEKYPGKRILCIHGADHNYWYHESLKEVENIELVYPLR
ncbi:hypothetical protein [Salimicrobium halophilum]|uniref:Uncharacterized protein n=1 Tax=Salimicrobium halophilum TaxID=86666 RepID=A0A1G8RH08_9BACI|nr:hypothetical protein [Salimicrobium halophilum]SDJ16384.1 hypothetical protein SAMN04490247_1035 [Salimicrobium halophilum]